MADRGRRGGTGAAQAPKTVHVVVSYVPLLRGEAGAAFEVAKASGVLERLLETDAGHVEAVLWAQDAEGLPWPVLVLDRGAEVFDHLVDWAEGSPSVWFKLAWAERRDRYALALAPRVERSVERYKIARRLTTGEDVPTDASFKIVFKPVLFSGPKSAFSGDVLRRLPRRAWVGFLPRAELPAELAGFDPSNVRLCGPIDVERDRTGHLQRLLR